MNRMDHNFIERCAYAYPFKIDELTDLYIGLGVFYGRSKVRSRMIDIIEFAIEGNISIVESYVLHLEIDKL